MSHLSPGKCADAERRITGAARRKARDGERATIVRTLRAAGADGLTAHDLKVWLAFGAAEIVQSHLVALMRHGLVERTPDRRWRVSL